MDASTSATWAVLQHIELDIWTIKYHLQQYYQQFSSSLVLAWPNPPELLRCESTIHVHIDVTEVCLRQWGSRVGNMFSWDIICPSHTMEVTCKRVWPKAKLMSWESISAVIHPMEQTSQASIVHITENTPQNITAVGQAPCLTINTGSLKMTSYRLWNKGLLQNFVA